jgi:hypothetical protein
MDKKKFLERVNERRIRENEIGCNHRMIKNERKKTIFFTETVIMLSNNIIFYF